MTKTSKKTVTFVKRIFAFFLAMILLCTADTAAFAASKPKPPKKISAKTGVYYEYIEKHGIMGGDCYSLRVNWSSVAEADGYKVVLYWNSEGTKTTQVVNVTKKNGAYYYTTTKNSPLYQSVKNLVEDNNDNSFSSEKLSFYVSGGSSEAVEKISIKSYKKVKGEKVYSKATTKKL